MATSETFHAPSLGEQGQACANCGAALATDQRYCLNCGTRRAEPRVAFADHLGGDGTAPPQTPVADGTQAPPPGGSQQRDWGPLLAIGALAALGVMFVLGVLIGKDSSGSGDAPRPVIQVGSGAGPATASTGASSGGSQPVADTGPVKSDWPSGKGGYTVELGTLPKGGTTASDVDGAKSDAEGKGAKDVGALDSDLYASLPAGKYVIYSGVYEKKADATKALGGLKKSFPDAQVVTVSKQAAAAAAGPTTNSVNGLTAGGSKGTDNTVTASDNALKQLNNQSGSGYEKTIKKLPDTIATQGAPAPIDHSKAPGAGSGATVVQVNGHELAQKLGLFRTKPKRRSGVLAGEDLERAVHGGQPAAPGGAQQSGAQPAAPKSDLARRRDELAREFTELQWDLGGLAYEMASRDHFRLDVLVRQAARLQQVDAELAEAERILKLDEAGAAGSCPSCGALYARGAVFCWQCGHDLLQRTEVPAAAPPPPSPQAPQEARPPQALPPQALPQQAEPRPEARPPDARVRLG